MVVPYQIPRKCAAWERWGTKRECKRGREGKNHPHVPTTQAKHRRPAAYECMAQGRGCPLEVPSSVRASVTAPVFQSFQSPWAFSFPPLPAARDLQACSSAERLSIKYSVSVSVHHGPEPKHRQTLKQPSRFYLHCLSHVGL
jgi:hypothetical protein